MQFLEEFHADRNDKFTMITVNLILINCPRLRALSDLGQWTALEPAEAAKVKSDCYELNYDLDTRSHQKLRKYLEMREFERKAYVNLIAGPTLERIRMAREAAEEEAAG